MEVGNGVFGIVKMLNRFLSGIFNGPSRLFDHVFELLLRYCWLVVEDLFNLELFICILTNDKARAHIGLARNGVSWC